MKILVTGAKGFVGKNLCIELKNRGHEVFAFDRDNTQTELEAFCREAEFVFHLAGVNRPKEEKEFTEGNADFSAQLCGLLKACGNKAPIAMTSSVQTALGNAYGNSKIEGEAALFAYEKETGAPVYVFRLANVFGKWCRPNYNSMVATFCHNTAHDLPITIHDENAEVHLLYIDDLNEILIALLEGCVPPMLTPEVFAELLPSASAEGIAKALSAGHAYYTAWPNYRVTVGDVARMVRAFKESRTTLVLPSLKEGLEKKLYSTFLSYLPEEELAVDLVMHCDARGSFTELLKSEDHGQVSVNITAPGITKGGHWHHTKNEKFIVVSGEALIRLRKVEEETVSEYRVSGKHIQSVDIPPGYTHSITNVGDTDLVTIMWANEIFDPEHPDTFALPV